MPTSNDTKRWLHRRLWKPASRQLLGGDRDQRPQTAPQIPIDIALPSPRLAVHPPPRPPRPESGVIRDVNAWLDASMDLPPPPLMGGLPYWRAASAVPSITTTDVQYAIPIVREPGRPLTPSSQQVKSFCRRAKKMQAKVPTLLRTTSQRIVARKQISRRSHSMPLLAIPYGQTREAAPPKLVTVSTRAEVPLLPPSAACTQSLLRQTSGSPLSTAITHVSREESMGDVSEAPTYSSGRPPPSYRSRTASIVTTSSFGCVDGMSPAQRQVSQQRALKCRGVRGRVKELRRRFQEE
ncbi:hypothetical protein EKO04_004387 [Ascochyta lentis]|uniref:Uncharacterized protein n=1 Tax=Ascochyta lentis TaxID=205686 RepID=A0A8H7J6B6_9PLEO|nr:hypothetical protein EKO04_004387 [Ascochyta lentis]